VPSIPDELSVVPVLSHRFRFYASADFSGTITATMLCGITGLMGTTGTTTTACQWASVRLRRVIIWPVQGTAAANFKTAISWVGAISNVSSEKERDRTLPIGLTTGGPTVFSIPRDSIVYGKYVENDFGNMIQIMCSLGSIIEVDACWLGVGNNLAAFSQTVASETPGVLYYPALDGVSSNKLKPTKLPTGA